MAANIENFDFDPDKLREKYKEERDKRVRADGNEQYKEVKGEFSYFVDDPYIEKKNRKKFSKSSYRNSDNWRRVWRHACCGKTKRSRF